MPYRRPQIAPNSRRAGCLRPQLWKHRTRRWLLCFHSCARKYLVENLVTRSGHGRTTAEALPPEIRIDQINSGVTAIDRNSSQVMATFDRPVTLVAAGSVTVPFGAEQQVDIIIRASIED